MKTPSPALRILKWTAVGTGVLLALLIAAGIIGTLADDESTPKDDRSTTATYMDQQRDDVVASLGQPVTLSGMEVIVTDPRVRQGYFGSTYCVKVAYRNIDHRTRRFSWTEWRLQLPNGVVEDATLNTSPEALGSEDLVAGGNVAGAVCFDESTQSGQHVLIWKPNPFNKARGIWLITR